MPRDPSAPVQARPTPFVPMDPRIRRRRIEVRRDEGLRRLRLLVAGLVVVVLTAAIWFGLRSPLLDVDRVTIRGAEYATVEAVGEAAGIPLGQPLVDVDLEGARVAVEAVPWVDRARIERVWPSTVLITVTERLATAVTSTNTGEWAILDPTGRVVEVVPERPAGLLVLEGLGDVPQPGVTVATAEGPLRVFAALSPSLAARTLAVAAIKGGQIELKLNPQGTVRMGSVEGLGAKVRAAETVLASVDVRNLAVLDVRLPSSPVLTRG